MNTKNLGLLIVVLVVLIVGGWLLYSGQSKGSVTGPLQIGFVAPLTGDGAAYGLPVENGVKLAVADINKAGGLNGRQIEVDYEDGKCTGQDAASAVQKLVSVTGDKYIIGGVCSGETFAMIPITSPAKVLVISPGSSAPKLSQSGPYFLRNNPNDNAPGTALADYAAKNYKTAAIISEQTDFAQGLKTVFTAEAQKQNLKIVSAQDYTSDITDFRSVLINIQAAHPDVIFINPQTDANLVRIAQQARQIGIQSAFIAGVFNGSAVVNAGTPTNNMVLAVAPGLATDGKGAAFTSEYTAAYGAAPNYAFYAGAGYDDVYLLAQAIEKVGDDSTKVEEYLHSMPSYTGTIGTYSFDQNGDMIGITSILQKIVNKQLINL